MLLMLSSFTFNFIKINVTEKVKKLKKDVTKQNLE